MQCAVVLLCAFLYQFCAVHINFFILPEYDSRNGKESQENARKSRGRIWVKFLYVILPFRRTRPVFFGFQRFLSD